MLDDSLKLIDEFSRFYSSIGKSADTVKNYRYLVTAFFKIVKKRFNEVEVKDVVLFIADQKYSPKTLYLRYVSLNIFYKYLEAEGLIIGNVMKKVPKPKVNATIPKKVMTKGEAQKVLAINKKNETDVYEYRNRLICELMYSCSLRRSELVNLQLDDYDKVMCSLRVRQSKNVTQKVVPVGRVAKVMLEKYIDTMRPDRSEHKNIFLTKYNKPLGVEFVTRLVCENRKKSKIRTKASSHSFRKTSASEMLRKGAKLEIVQRLLGQRSIISTEAYAKIYPVDLERIVRAKHPRERQKNIKLPELKIPKKINKYINFVYGDQDHRMRESLKLHPREQEVQLPTLNPIDLLTEKYTD